MTTYCFEDDKKSIVAGWFNDKQKAVKTAEQLDRIGAEGIYITLNQCQNDLLARSNNRLKAGVDRTQDRDIVMLCWLLVDVDPKRPVGVSSTNHQHTLALDHANWIGSALKAKGWSNPLIGDSGNGAHLVYRLPDLANHLPLISQLHF